MRRGIHYRGAPSRHSASGGFTLIEILIALVVLAVGLLGLAMLQTMNLRYTKSAQQRTQATVLAGQLLDTMRTNRSEVSAYVMTDSDFASVTVPATGCVAGATSTASTNATRWKCEVKANLGADATASVSVTPASLVTVNIRWDESLVNNATGSTGNVILETTL
ncbi:type IV pilus modification protein PilV [Luteimonas fraxinea]|uniref:Type IV pilus modification protein PilV n=1 Tax=Luteimonas fraxinea TaxID=2901869 RepID=A0ABS8UB74_9GAMM|nr:type IV pilus modification protein PilV [Luteimonas fraxinea]MCD9096110.1 type IV pilus modification protein PilV [Luteimonas fraxinea]MCD9124699.1 type IV pilus modification protein PilV [Luteimonas fraxinea]UHH10721.1 type IV pilus modification protein PilV [Luteimonas fraxinea]